MNPQQRTDTELQRIERMILLSQGIVLRSIHLLKEEFMSALDDATASTAAKVATLSAKVDAALAALAASVASQTPVTQAELDAITAIGAVADAEGAKVDAALAPAGTDPAPADPTV